MLDGDLLDALDVVAKMARNNSGPFGGVHLILCGDFFQLPPIGVVRDCCRHCCRHCCPPALLTNDPHASHSTHTHTHRAKGASALPLKLAAGSQSCMQTLSSRYVVGSLVHQQEDCCDTHPPSPTLLPPPTSCSKCSGRRVTIGLLKCWTRCEWAS